jgi:hypothetical protein
MGFFDSANPEERVEEDYKEMIRLLTEIRDLLKESLESSQPQQ